MKIGSKLSIGFLTVTAIFCMVGYFSVRTSEQALREVINKKSAIIAETLMSDLDRLIYDMVEAQIIYVRGPMVQDAVTQSNLKFARLGNTEDYIKRADLDWISVPKESVTPFMQQLMDNDLAGRLKKRIEIYNEIYGYKTIDEIFITNKYGANIAQTGKTASYRQDNESWWQQAKTKGVYLSDFSFDESSGIHSVYLAVQIKDEKGKFAGVLKAVLSTKSINEIMDFTKSSFKYGKTQISLLTRQGRILYTTKSHEASGLIGISLGADVLSRLQSTLPVHSFDKDGKLYSYAYSDGYRGHKILNWILLVEHDGKEVFEPVFTMRNRIISATIVIIAGLLFLGFGTIRHISGNIAQLRAAAVKVGGGDLDVDIDIKSNDETGELASAFKTMANNLKKTTTSIENLNREITWRQQAEERQGKLLKELENVNHELKDFAYVVSHDLKAPLRGIKTLVEWFSTDYADKVDENGREQLRLLSSRVDRMHNLIDGVLQYSRIGRTESKAAKVDLKEIVAEAVDMVAAPPNITITVENNLPEVICGRTRITQVFQNLLSNAIKFMDKPQGWVKIRCEDQQDFWRFSVADNGPGIEERHFEQIFKIFQTLSNKDDYESTGIGLTLVKKIVELYGGVVWVESKVGEGSTFYFTLPKLKATVNDGKELAHAIC